MENLNSLDGFYQKVSQSLNLVNRVLRFSQNTQSTHDTDFVQAVCLHKIPDSLIHDH
jgi:hypothetical protein